MSQEKENILQVLEKQGLRKTQVRTDVLAFFIDKPFALCHSDIEQALGSKYDRVTLYRTLHTFEEKGVIHKVPDETGVNKYALCQEHCTNESHRDEHVHFFCTKCARTFCLDSVHIPAVTMPENYLASSYSFTVSGLCPECLATTKQ